MRVNTSRHNVKYLALDARIAGTQETDTAGTGDTRCLAPVELHAFGYPDKILVGFNIEPDKAVAQRLKGRCRKCTACLRHRGRLWTARAMDETGFSIRTWMGTLTLHPDRQTWARYTAIADLRRRGHDDPSSDAVFQRSVHVIGQEITRFLKRVRKKSRFRYLLVTEAHKSGLPHFHMLLHEYASPILKRDLEKQWVYGFSHWRLVDNDNARQCGYVCKYLTKSALTRVRASADYGTGSIALTTERLTSATRDIQMPTLAQLESHGYLPLSKV